MISIIQSIGSVKNLTLLNVKFLSLEGEMIESKKKKHLMVCYSNVECLRYLYNNIIIIYRCHYKT